MSASDLAETRKHNLGPVPISPQLYFTCPRVQYRSQSAAPYTASERIPGPLALKYMLHLDYISCLLTILSTVLIGKRLWHGWILAAVNSLIVCVIGIQTAQYGFLPGNLLCIGLYAHNLANWRPGMHKQCAPSLALNDNQDNREQSLS